MGSFTKREQIVILLFVVIIIALIGFNLLGKNHISIVENSNEKDEIIIESSAEKTVDDNESIEGETKNIMVHISGQVNKPGLVVLKEGDRVADAVEMAGGLKSEADYDRINLAKKLADEEKIYIPSVGEEVSSEEYSNKSINSSVQDNNKKININTASKDELMSLPGIGEVLSQKIIDYRSSTEFERIEDIMNVPSIGEKRYEAIKDMIMVK